MLQVTFDDKFIYFNGQVNDCEINSFTNFDEQLYNEITKYNWNCYIDKTTGGLGAVRSARKIGDETMYLDQFVFNYFSPDFYKKASENGYIVKHFNDNKYDCSFDNLLMSLELGNTYNGATLSKIIKENRDYISARTLQVRANNTIQAQVSFNNNNGLRKVLFNGKLVDKINLLYKNDYNLVLNDIDMIFTNILDVYIPSNKIKQNGDSIEISTIIANCKNNDIKVEYTENSEQIYLTEDECATIRKVGYIFKVINGQLNAITANEIALYNNTLTETNNYKEPAVDSWDLK